MSLLKTFFGRSTPPTLGVAEHVPAEVNAQYWTDHNVTLHATFPSAQASLEYFAWRNAQYFPYIDLMPVHGQAGKVVLDYGCGPGNDLVGFGHFSKPARLIGADISKASLSESYARLKLHGIQADLIQIREENQKLPFEDGTVDYVHSSGVVHHARNPELVLREFRRILRPNGACRIMVYNYNSIWVHLYVAFIKKFREGLYTNLDIREAFAKTTDGENCPISRAYTPGEFCEIAASAGFQCEFVGAAVSMWECRILPDRFEAIMNQKFPAEHRDFLLNLTFDERGYPMYHNTYAGIDGCYLLTPA